MVPALEDKVQCLLQQVRSVGHCSTPALHVSAAGSSVGRAEDIPSTEAVECGFVLQGPVRGLKAHSYGRIYTLERWRLGLLQAGSGVLAQPSPAAGPRDGAEASAPTPPLKGTCHGFTVLHVGSPGFPKSVCLGRVALHVVAASFPGRLDQEHLTLTGAGHPAAPAAGVKSSGALGK